jgi:homoserine dehydrogenase
VHGEYNAVIVETSAAGDLMFYGKGAGAGPAASAVVGDVFMLSQEILTGLADTASDPIWAKGGPIKSRPIQETSSAYYLRLKVADRPGVLSQITGVLGKKDISIARIHQDLGEPLRTREATIFITTHPAAHWKMEHAVKSVLALPFVSKQHAWLRMLS